MMLPLMKRGIQNGAGLFSRNLIQLIESAVKRIEFPSSLHQLTSMDGMAKLTEFVQVHPGQSKQQQQQQQNGNAREHPKN